MSFIRKNSLVIWIFKQVLYVMLNNNCKQGKKFNKCMFDNELQDFFSQICFSFSS